MKYIFFALLIVGVFAFSATVAAQDKQIPVANTQVITSGSFKAPANGFMPYYTKCDSLGNTVGLNGIYTDTFKQTLTGVYNSVVFQFTVKGYNGDWLMGSIYIYTNRDPGQTNNWRPIARIDAQLTDLINDAEGTFTYLVPKGLEGKRFMIVFQIDEINSLQSWRGCMMVK